MLYPGAFRGQRQVNPFLPGAQAPRGFQKPPIPRESWRRSSGVGPYVSMFSGDDVQDSGQRAAMGGQFEVLERLTQNRGSSGTSAHSEGLGTGSTSRPPQPQPTMSGHAAMHGSHTSIHPPLSAPSTANDTTHVLGPTYGVVQAPAHQKADADRASQFSGQPQLANFGSGKRPSIEPDHAANRFQVVEPNGRKVSGPNDSGTTTGKAWRESMVQGGRIDSSAPPLDRLEAIGTQVSGDKQKPDPRRDNYVSDLRRLIESLPKDGVAQNFSSLDFYQFGKTLGEGAYGKVKLGLQLITGEKVAIKMFERSKIADPSARRRVSREIRILKALQHPRIVRLFEVVESSTRKHVIMEYASGGDLCHYVREKKRLSEAEAGRLFVQALDALNYCHRRGVVHRFAHSAHAWVAHHHLPFICCVCVCVGWSQRPSFQNVPSSSHWKSMITKVIGAQGREAGQSSSGCCGQCEAGGLWL